MTDGAGLWIRQLEVQRAGRTVLDKVDMELHAGEITGLVGANGAGKTTLVMTVAGTLPALSGSVEMDGIQLLGKSPDAVRRSGLSVVPEGHRVLGPLNVLDNLRAAGSMLSRAELDQEIGVTLELFPELETRLSVMAFDLSGGQKQMVAIAQALIARPRYLLIDELSFGLAPTVVQRLGDTLRAVAGRGVAILLIEQFTTLALALSNRAYVMERGRIAFAGSADELRQRPEILHGAYLAGNAPA